MPETSSDVEYAEDQQWHFNDSFYTTDVMDVDNEM